MRLLLGGKFLAQGDDAWKIMLNSMIVYADVGDFKERANGVKDTASS